LAVRIRLRRTGGTNDPHYRLVVIDARRRREGRSLEIIGHYHPQTDPPQMKVNEEKALKWLEVGAQPSDTVKMILSKTGVMAKFTAMKEERRKEAEEARAKEKAKS